MKRIGIVLFCALSICVIALAGNALAYNATFTHTAYQSETSPTIDGTYAMGPEWLASKAEPFGTNGFWRDMWIYPGGFGENGFLYVLIETRDATNNAGDQWTICFDSTDTAGDAPDAGATPKTNDYKIVVTGHGGSQTIQWYKGTGTGWATRATPPAAIFSCAQQLTATPKIGAQHYVLECKFDKTDTATLGTTVVSYTWATFVSYFDAEPGGFGLQQWPPANATPAGSPDNPNSWGYVPYEMAVNPTPDVPESIGLGVMVTMSSIAIVTGTYIVRKRKA